MKVRELVDLLSIEEQEGDVFIQLLGSCDGSPDMDKSVFLTDAVAANIDGNICIVATCADWPTKAS